MRSVRSMLRALLLGLFVVLFWFLLPNLLYLGGALLFPDRAEGLLSFLSFFGTALSALFLMGCNSLLEAVTTTLSFCVKHCGTPAIKLTLMLDGYSWEIRFLPIIVSSSSMRTPYWTRLLSTTEKWRLINWTREKLLWTSSSPCRTSPKAVTPLSGRSCPE